MKLWLISQTENNDYDTYDSAVVAAETEDAARNTHPNGGDFYGVFQGLWAKTPNDVTVRLIGEAAPGIEAGVLCASFNPG
jgi:hypothetical protein